MIIKDQITPVRIIALQKAIQAGTGLVTALLVTIYLSPEEQGYFYTMGSLLSGYILLDLGLSNLLVQISAKHFTKLKWNRKREIIPNDANRLHFFSLVHQGLRWYLCMGVLTLTLIPIGFFYFTYAHPTSTVNWQAPWILIVLCIALCMPSIGFMSILEGSHRIIEVYSLRIIHYFFGAFMAWLLLFSGNGLFALAMPPLAIFSLICFWMYKNYRHLFNEIAYAEKIFNWKQEVEILHKRVAVSWLGNYLFLHMPTPIIFYFLGPDKAGQFGLSITIANVVASICTSKVASIIPRYSHLVQQQDFKNADDLFKKNFWASIKFSLVVIVFLTIFAYFAMSFFMLDRLLPWDELFILLLALVSFHGANIMASYFRAYGKEPMKEINIYTSVITLSCLGYLISENFFLQAILLLLASSVALLGRSLYLAQPGFELNSDQTDK